LYLVTVMHSVGLHELEGGGILSVCPSQIILRGFVMW
jgi:hypothetical protein